MRLIRKYESAKKQFDLFSHIAFIATLWITLISLFNTSESVPLQYSDYTSTKYHITFQYPSDWTVNEKTNRFEEGADIKISIDHPGRPQMTIDYTENLLSEYRNHDIENAVRELQNRFTSDFSYDYRMIEQPTFLAIDNVKTGTFVFTFKAKDISDPITGAMQLWLTYVGNSAYLLNFISTPDTFDSAENEEMRSRLISTIRFLNAGNQTS